MDMESIWTGPYGMDMESIWNGHGIHMNQSIWNPYGMEMESIWNGSFHVHSMSIPYGFHSGYGMRKWLGPQPKSFHMDSMEWTWNPYGFHMDSIWINPGRVKTSITRVPISCNLGVGRHCQREYNWSLWMERKCGIFGGGSGHESSGKVGL